MARLITKQILQAECDTLKRNNQVLLNRASHAEARLRDVAQTNEELKRQLMWHKQLSQNLSEAVCAYMRNR